jgi:glycosyltransferase involved in cell wall biosynthesis
MKLSVVILTFNEEINLPRCLSSLRGLEAETFLVDSGSTDQTLEIAALYGAAVVHHPFETHAVQWAWALQSLPLSTDWVLALDADQSLTPEAVQELRALDPGAINGYYIKRRQVFRGRWIKHGGYYPKYLLKLFRRDKVALDSNDLLDHHFYVTEPTGKLRHDLTEQNTKEDDITFWIEKHNRYSTLMAREEFLRKQGDITSPLEASLWGSPDQRMLRLKQAWRRLPLLIRPFLYFFYRYILRAGWLDGKEGFIFHFLQAFWFRLLVDIKLEELAGREPARPEASLAPTHTLKAKVND